MADPCRSNGRHGRHPCDRNRTQQGGPRAEGAGAPFASLLATIIDSYKLTDVGPFLAWERYRSWRGQGNGGLLSGAIIAAMISFGSLWAFGLFGFAQTA